MIRFFVRFFPFFLVLHEIAIYLSNDMYLSGMPQIVDEMGYKDLVQNTVTVWVFGSGLMQVLLGPISDHWGRRPVMILGCIVFIITSVICGYSSNIFVLLVARFFQGTVAGSIYVAGHAIIHELYDDRTSIRIFALMGMVTVVAPAVGPLAGAWMIESTGWRGIFLFLACFGVLNTAFMFLATPETVKSQAPLNVHSVLSDYKSLLSNHIFVKLCLIFALLMINLVIWNISSPLIIMQGLGYSGTDFGWIQCCIFGMFIVGAFVVGLLIKKYSPFFMVGAGALICFLGNLIFLVAAYYTSNLIVVVAPIMLISFGTGIAMSPLNRLTIRSSNIEMGKKIAMLSTIIGVLCGVFGFTASVFDNENFFNLSVLYFICGLLSIMIYFCNLRSFKNSVIIT